MRGTIARPAGAPLDAANPTELVRDNDLKHAIAHAPSEELALCRTCGACCSFSREWPRFTTEDDIDLDRMPHELVDHRLGRMRCNGDRCAALEGEVGVWTSCAIYGIRPDVCRTCAPGDDACKLARHRFGL